MEELNVIPILDRVKNYRRKWRDHVGRMDEERSPSQRTGDHEERARERRDDTYASSSSAKVTSQTGQSLDLRV